MCCYLLFPFICTLTNPPFVFSILQSRSSEVDAVLARSVAMLGSFFLVLISAVIWFNWLCILSQISLLKYTLMNRSKIVVIVPNMRSFGLNWTCCCCYIQLNWIQLVVVKYTKLNWTCCCCYIQWTELNWIYCCIWFSNGLVMIPNIIFHIVIYTYITWHRFIHTYR
jgi:hypothetical protein